MKKNSAALQLHPDKNKHSKAEVAFKLISEVEFFFQFSVLLISQKKKNKKISYLFAMQSIILCLRFSIFLLFSLHNNVANFPIQFDAFFFFFFLILDGGQKPPVSLTEITKNTFITVFSHGF